MNSNTHINNINHIDHIVYVINMKHAQGELNRMKNNPQINETPTRTTKPIKNK